jgi:EmrB/QacA subfamily drug resistance transporter
MENKNLKWFVLATVIIGTFLGRIDQTIVNLALPKVIEDFGITISSAGWIATAYILANAVFVPIWGKLGDTIGRKRVYLTGFIIFIIGSVLAGLSWNLGSLIVFRVIQAIAGSADYPTAMAILTVTFTEGKERAQALGIWSASFAAAAVFGPLIGGPLIDNFGWRSVFLVNLPIGIIGMIMAIVYVKESTSLKKTVSFDWWGATILGIVLSSIVLVLDKGQGWGWLSMKSNICYAVVVVFSTIFYYLEKNHIEPIIDFKFFKNFTFNATLLNNFITFMGLMGSIYLIPIFAQTFLGYDATETGYLFIPMAFALMLGAPLGGRLIGKVKASYVIAISTGIAAVGLYFFSFLDPRSSAIAIIIPLAIMAFGLGFGMAQRTSAIASAVPADEIGVASSILALVRNIAGAFGISVFATILVSSEDSGVLKIAQHSVIQATTAAQHATAIGLIILKAQVSSYATVYLVAAVIMVFGAASAFLIKTDKTLDTVHVHVE